MSDQFTGRWLITEYHYNPRGDFRGIVEQTRALSPMPDGTTEVRQICTPDARLRDAFTLRFAGEWVFTMRREGMLRRYLGPDVIGSGISLGDETIIGTGRWPRFGHDFTSYGCLITPHRQITGGSFFNQDGAPVTHVVGVGIPETHEAAGQFARLNQTVRPDPRRVWVGDWALYSTRGEMQSPQTLRRCIKDACLIDELTDGTRQEIDLSSAISCGCMQILEREHDHFLCQQTEIYDDLSQTIIGLRTWKDPDTSNVTGYEIYRLTPED